MKWLGHVEDAPAVLSSLTREGDSAAFSFDHHAWYHSPEERLTLVAACNDEFQCVIHDDARALTQAAGNAATVADVSKALGRAVIDLSKPLPLETVRIPKPWGAELWYTGMEARGVCTVSGIPLPWILELAGAHLHGNADPTPVLLKILDPHPEPVYGDLYFEMHEEKIEVYIVTHVDESAWPDGNGGIRFGFDEDKVAECASRDAFLAAYLETVKAYGKLRRAIDTELDAIRSKHGIKPDAVVDPKTLEEWKNELDPELIANEQKVLAEMNAFTAIKPIKVGDVIRVPNFTPHSLQHGVRVVEFQTPHYERYILSFAQKVLTQDHWDTEEAIGKINWEATFDTSLPELHHHDGVEVHQVADFDAFEVRRIRLGPGGRHQFDIDAYALAMVIEGSATICGSEFGREKSAFIPAACSTVAIESNESAIVLVAVPRPE